MEKDLDKKNITDTLSAQQQAPENTPLTTAAPAETSAAAETVNSTAKESTFRSYPRRWFALAALVLALCAWFALVIPTPSSGFWSLGISVLTVVCALIGMRMPRGAWRNTAIASFIAGLVLFVVLAAYIAVIYIVLG